MIQHSQLVFVVSVVRYLLGEMLFLCVVAVPETVQVVVIRLEEFHAVWVVHMIEGVIYDCLLAIYSQASSLSLAVARGHVVLDTAIVEIYNMDVA